MSVTHRWPISRENLLMNPQWRMFREISEDEVQVFSPLRHLAHRWVAVVEEPFEGSDAVRLEVREFEAMGEVQVIPVECEGCGMKASLAIPAEEVSGLAVDAPTVQ